MKFLSIVLTLVVLWIPAAAADIVIMHSGAQYSGEIIKEHASYVRLITPLMNKGQYKELLRDNIEEILYGEYLTSADIQEDSAPHVPKETLKPIVHTFSASGESTAKVESVQWASELADISPDTDPKIDPAMELTTTSDQQSATAEEVSASEPIVLTNASLVAFEAASPSATEMPQALAPLSDIPNSAETSLQRVQNLVEAEARRQGGNFDPQNMDPAVMDNLLAEMENSVEETLQQQSGWMIGFFLKAIFIFLLIFGTLSFFIARKIDAASDGDDVEDIRSIPIADSQPAEQLETRDTEQAVNALDRPAPIPPKVLGKAGLIRRALAVTIDMSFGTVIVSVLLILPGIFVPLDSMSAMPLYGLVVAAFGVYGFYLMFGYVKWRNTYGRYVMGVRVVDDDTLKKPGYRQALKRSFTFLLWPIEVLTLLLTRSKRRLGDLWAGTSVKRITSSAPWMKRAWPGFSIIAAGYILTAVVGPLANSNMAIAQAAREHVERNTRYTISGKHPVKVQLQGPAGTVNFDLEDSNGKSLSLYLEKSQDRWIVKDATLYKDKYFGLMTMTF